MNDNFNEIISAIPEASSPIFRMDNVNDNITLYDGLIYIKTSNGQFFDRNGKVFWSWLPRPNILFECSIDELNQFNFIYGKYEIHLHDIDTKCEGFTTRQRTHGNTVMIRGVLSSGIEKTNGAIDRLKFHIANLNKYVGTHIKKLSKNGIHLGRISLQYKEWNIIIDELDDYSENNIIHEYNGGFKITHVGVITRRDGNLFELNDARDLLDKLRLFFGFVESRHCPPLLLVGERNSELVSLSYKAAALSSFRGRTNWCPPNLAVNAMVAVWNGFENLHSLFGNLLSVLISYLVTANAQAEQSQRIIFATTILEMLFWKMVNKDGMLQDADKLRLADKIRLLLLLYDIPLNIPKAFTKLSLAAQNKWFDGPHAITEIRNSFTHAKNMERVLDFDVIPVHQAVELALWYAETVLLKNIGVTEDIDWRIRINSHLGDI